MRNPIASIAPKVSGLCMLLAMTGAGADSAVQQLPTVTLYGSSSLRASCPEAEKTLQESLEHTVRVRRQEGVMRVRFTLQGDQVSNVQAVAGPGAYRQQVREIIGKLQCRAQSQHAQVHAFDIDFTFG